MLTLVEPAHIIQDPPGSLVLTEVVETAEHRQLGLNTDFEVFEIGKIISGALIEVSRSQLADGEELHPRVPTVELPQVLHIEEEVHIIAEKPIDFKEVLFLLESPILRIIETR